MGDRSQGVFMYDSVYIDVVFLINLLMDYFLLRIVGKIFRCRAGRGRTLLAALGGALFSCLILYVPEKKFFWAVIPLHGACAAGMAMLGLGLKKGSLLAKAVATLYLLAFLGGGVWEAVSRGEGISPFAAFLLALCIYLGLTALVYLWESFLAVHKSIYPISLSFQGKVHWSYGLYDTGNLLSDPVSGAPVSIMEPKLLEKVLSARLMKKLKHLEENPGEMESTELARLQPRLLSYRTLDGGGILLAVTLEDLMIHTPREVVHIYRPVFALSAEPSALGKEYKVLLNSRLLH